MREVENGVVPLRAEQPSAEDERRVNALGRDAFERARRVAILAGAGADADDVANRIAAIVCKRSRANPDYFDQPDQLSRFITTAAQNAVDNVRRAERRRVRREAMHADMVAGGLREWEHAVLGLETKEALERIASAVDELSPRCREAMTLRLMEGMSRTDMANALGISQSAVTKLLWEGLRKLEKSLEPLLAMAESTFGGKKRSPTPVNKEQQR